MRIKKNIGTPDRIARVVIGIILLALVSIAFIGPKTPYGYWGILGIIPLVSGISGVCPPYQLLGINTHVKKNAVNL